MIKKTLYFSHPAYLSLHNAQLVIKASKIDNGVDELKTPLENLQEMIERTIPIEDIGVVVLDHKQITVTSGAMTALLENNLLLSAKTFAARVRA